MGLLKKINRTISRSNVFLLSHANDNFYLNTEFELNKLTGEYYQKDIKFNKWTDLNSIDFNGWWQIEVLDDSSQAKFRNFNSGKFLVFNPNDKDKV